jgi:rhamnosyltransferase
MEIINERVLVLLAAYNGKKWITEQIHSILAQKGCDITIVVSVDLSSDGTEEIVKTLADVYPNLYFLPMGQRFGGAAKNFYRLIIEADFSEYDFISLADQDDVWNPNKIANALVQLKKNDVYSSNVKAFWENGKECLINKAQPFVEYDFLFEAAGPGCTYVMKKEFALHLKYFLRTNFCDVNDISLHDWLIYAFSRRFKYKWFIDQNPGMMYRQHSLNQVGANNNLKALFKRFLLIKNKWYRNEVEKLINILSMQNEPFVKKTILRGYIGNLILLKNISKIRRRFRDRVLLSFMLAFNFF